MWVWFPKNFFALGWFRFFFWFGVNALLALECRDELSLPMSQADSIEDFLGLATAIQSSYEGQLRILRMKIRFSLLVANYIDEKMVGDIVTIKRFVTS